METARMKSIVTIATLLLAAAGAQASEVYKTIDAQGRPVYTDKPVSLPAEKLNVKTATTDMVEAQQRYEEQMKGYSEADKARAEAASKAAETQKAGAMTAEDRARRCEDARQRYESYMNARRLFEPGASEGERRYLSAAEIDAARADAKKVMDEFCSGQ
jgi:hypothetical protein